MINQVVLCGRTSSKFVTEKDNVVMGILSIDSVHGKNEIPFVVKNKDANCLLGVKKGSMVGIKGHLENINKEIKVYAEHISVVPSKTQNFIEIMN